MKNKTLILIVFFMLGITLHSFAAFPVRHAPATESSSANIATTQDKAPLTTTATDKVYKATHRVEKVLHLHKSILPEKKKKNTLGTLSLIFGILGVLSSFTVVFGLAFSIPALVLGAKGMKQKEPFSQAGTILGIVGIVISFVVLIIEVFVLLAFLGFLI